MAYLKVESKADFKKNVKKALQDEDLNKNLKKAMLLLKNRRQQIFADQEQFEILRQQAQWIRQKALSKLPQLLEEFEKKALSNGFIIHWAENSLEANQIILQIIKSKNASLVIKGKSMISEEINCNEFLKKHNIVSLETDLGEFIIQLNNDPPSHIVVPAVQKTKEEVAEIFKKYLNISSNAEITQLTAIAREHLRANFLKAQVSLTGVNFALAESGSIVLIENEGNGRMCTTLPQTQIALMSLEKIIEKKTDLPILLKLLAGSATGQLIPNYVNIINKAKTDKTLGQPQEIHLIILDNGRSEILADPILCQTLQCIRCGACLNHCPVYSNLSGLAYGSVYPGPMGILLNTQLEGLAKKGILTTASSLCSACDDVCPVKIPISDLIRKLKNENHDKNGTVLKHGHNKSLIEKTIWQIWSLIYSKPNLLNLFLKLSSKFGNLIPALGPLATWSKYRKRPQIAKKNLRKLIKEESNSHEQQ